jgi:fructose-specific phosphotransferase system IIC component
MKFINYLTSITGISIYPLISLLIFTAIFTVVLYKTFSESKQSIAEQSNLPLDDQPSI